MIGNVKVPYSSFISSYISEIDIFVSNSLYTLYHNYADNFSNPADTHTHSVLVICWNRNAKQQYYLCILCNEFIIIMCISTSPTHGGILCINRIWYSRLL